jgi:drug/metabolite transporter (DMT)-like permease
VQWLAVAAVFIGSLLFAVGNHTDKFLVDKERDGSSLESVMLFSTLVAGPIMLLAMLIYAKFEIAFAPIPAALAVLAAISYTLANYFYFRALEKNDTTVVIAMTQLIPVFTFIISAVFFQEFLTTRQMIGGAIIIASAVAISTNLKDLKNRQNYQVLGLMLLFSLFYAGFFKLFEVANKTSDYGSASVFFQFGLTLVGVFLWLRRKYRREFIKSIKQNGRVFVGLNVFNEIINAVAAQLDNWAVIFLPLAIVNTLAGFQPVFVLILGLVGAKFWPKIFQDKVSRGELIRKSFCILISLVGLYVMFS